jgi:hypothetical protein
LAEAAGLAGIAGFLTLEAGVCLLAAGFLVFVVAIEIYLMIKRTLQK